MADLDSLTGILNKGVVTARLDELLAAARTREEPLAILLFDVDHFKTYNDVNGHLAGDELLRRLAGVIGERIRQEDTFGRFGGDEFLLIFPGGSVSDAIGAGRSMMLVLEDCGFPFGENQPLGRITVSGGISACEPGACDGTELLLAADNALYRAKTAGRNRIVPTPILRRQATEAPRA
jgi:diguanylate cyclase (GGDEF)-like protein